MTERDTVSPLSRAYRSAAGLPERENDSVVSNDEASAARRLQEPEGGYGGEGGILNTGAINSAEQTGQANAARQQAAAEELSPAEGLTGGETATEVARVTGEDVPDVKPAGEAVATDPAEAEEQAREDEEA